MPAPELKSALPGRGKCIAAALSSHKAGDVAIVVYNDKLLLTSELI